MPDVAEAAVLAAGLEKRYGPRTVLRDISFRLDAGGVLLVTGPNGAGKTTLLRMVAGLAVPTRGSLHVAVDRRDVGYVGHEPLVYRELTAVENLDLFGRLYRVAERRERIGMLLERFGLWDVRRRAGLRLLAGHDATARALPGASPRSRAASSSTSRTPRSTTRGPRCSTTSSPHAWRAVGARSCWQRTIRVE